MIITYNKDAVFNMKKLLITLGLIASTATFIGCQSMSTSTNNFIITPVHAVNAEGVGQYIGEVKFSDSKQGLIIETNLSKLPAGPHGFHIHQNPSCEPDVKDGVAGAALKAGAHYDPKQSGFHAAPTADGHLGDLPLLQVDNQGLAQVKLLAPRLNLENIKGRAVMIHAGGDNYSDQPQALGGGGARIACGVIE